MEKSKRIYRLGLDIGIGSVGWAVVSEKDGIGRIENFGTRIFDSGELNKVKRRTSQERRGFRSVRRVQRRRKFRKQSVKLFLTEIGFLTNDEIKKAEENFTADIIPLKVRAIKEKISKSELLNCLIHTCNHRGYKDFYEIDEDEIENEDEAEEQGNIAAANSFDKNFRKSGCTIVSEYLMKNYKVSDGKINFRNKDHKEDERIIIRRKHMEKEIETILEKQSEFYNELTEENRKNIFEIIFRQRAFEDGPGQAGNSYRRYKGFIDSIGRCRFYPEENRGFRNTVIGDLFAGINALSQYRYVNKETGEVGLTPEIAKILIDEILKKGNLNKTEAKKLLKKENIEIYGSKDVDKTLTSSFKYIKGIKKITDEAKINWNTLISENQFEYEENKMSLLNKLGCILSCWQTPSKRSGKLEEFIKNHPKGNLFNDEVLEKLMKKKISGTSNASYHYMSEAVQAFLEGKIYGDFQWEREEKLLNKQIENNNIKVPVSALKNNVDIVDNPVVYRGINETRKIVNAIIDVYGMPEYINVEFAKDVAKSFAARDKEKKRQDKNREKNEKTVKEIAKILGIEETDVRGTQIERYKLYKEQECKCMYSGESLDLKKVLSDKDRSYEVDHIIPYSLILDDTLANKALVLGSENQIKKQRVPLMYLTGKKKEDFLKNVEAFSTRKVNPISAKKREYLLMPTIYGKEIQEKLKDWKSRNINDTRYITKFMIALLKSTLIKENENGEKLPHVYGIRGHITSRFRKKWLGKNWGNEEKPRESYLNHAADAVVIACLTQDDVRITMEYEKLRQMYRHKEWMNNDNYREALFRVAGRLKMFSKKSKEEIVDILLDRNFSTSIIPSLYKEVDVRFGPVEGDKRTEEEFRIDINNYYSGTEDFIVKPHLTHVSKKQTKRFRGTVADSNPIRLIDEEGEKIKISRKSIKDIKRKDLKNLHTNDTSLIEALNKVFEGKEDKDTVEKYMKENNLKEFCTAGGQKVYKVSVRCPKVSNYYKKQIDGKNFSILGVPKYYCVEVYEDNKGKTRTWGLRYVDMVKHEGKLYLKDNVLPKDYAKHVTYLFKGDYIVVYKKDEKIFEGYYQSVAALTLNRVWCTFMNNSELIRVSISSNCRVEKYQIDLLGRKCGKIDESRGDYPCFVPLSSKKKKS